MHTPQKQVNFTTFQQIRKRRNHSNQQQPSATTGVATETEAAASGTASPAAAAVEGSSGGSAELISFGFSAGEDSEAFGLLLWLSPYTPEKNGDKQKKS